MKKKKTPRIIHFFYITINGLKQYLYKTVNCISLKISRLNAALDLNNVSCRSKSETAVSFPSSDTK